jgi:hypothetical protein
MISYGIKFYDDDDIEKAKTIINVAMDGDD